MNVTTEIKNIRKKQKALYYDGMGLLIADVFNLINETLMSQTGMGLKNKEGGKLDAVDFVKDLENQYNIQLSELTSEHKPQNVYQQDLETAIQEAKAENI